MGGVLSAGTKGVDGIVWVNRTVRGGGWCVVLSCAVVLFQPNGKSECEKTARLARAQRQQQLNHAKRRQKESSVGFAVPVGVCVVTVCVVGSVVGSCVCVWCCFRDCEILCCVWLGFFRLCGRRR